MFFDEFFASKKVKVLILGFFADLLLLTGIFYGLPIDIAYMLVTAVSGKVATYIGIQGFVDAWTNGKTSSVVSKISEKN